MSVQCGLRPGACCRLGSSKSLAAGTSWPIDVGVSAMPVTCRLGPRIPRVQGRTQQSPHLLASFFAFVGQQSRPVLACIPLPPSHQLSERLSLSRAIRSVIPAPQHTEHRPRASSFDGDCSVQILGGTVWLRMSRDATTPDYNNHPSTYQCPACSTRLWAVVLHRGSSLVRTPVSIRSPSRRGPASVQ